MRIRTSPLKTLNRRCLIDGSHQVCSQNILVSSIFFSFSYHDVTTRHFIREWADSLAAMDCIILILPTYNAVSSTHLDNLDL
jgi:NAD(P)H-dependent FMN reductase